MSDPDRTSVSLLIVVTIVAVLVKIGPCSGWRAGSPPPTATQAAVGTVIVTGDSVNLRQAPARSASVLAQAERGQELELLATQEDWYNARWGEGTVWLSKLYASSVEDCHTEQATAAEALRRQLPGEWKGEIQGSPATFVFYTRGEQLCAYVLYNNVKEILAVEETSRGTLTLAGKRYERLAGSTGEFWLDTFSGQLEDSSGRLAGTYIDAKNNRGEWFAERLGSASGAALDTRSVSERSPSNDILFATGSQGEGVYEVDSSLKITQTAKTSLFNNTLLSWDRSTKRLYVSAVNGEVVSILATSPLREIATISQDVGWNTFSMVLSPDGRTLFLTCSTQGGPQEHDTQIVALDTASGTTRATLSVGRSGSASYLALSPDGTRLYLSRAGGVSIYSPSTLDLLQECGADDALIAGRILASKDDAFIYVAQAERLVRMRTDCSDTDSVNISGIASHFWISASDSSERLWVGSQRGGLYEVDTRTLAVRFLDLGFNAETFTESSDGRYLYVSTGDKNVLLDVDISTGTIVRSLAGINNVYGIVRR